jgi:carbamoyl-phosphate synthase large subunit
MKKIKKVIILGSGALKIGEAGEFDYSGSQAIKALKEEGIETVLVNPNIATIQTSEFLADHVYFLPVNEEFVEKVIIKEKPDAIMLSFGGQTALNCGVVLDSNGILKKYGVEVLGTPVEAIILTEDRDKFARHLRKIKVPVSPSDAAGSLTDAEKIAEKVGYPVMVRAAYALGGQKSGVAYNQQQLKEIVSEALAFSPQVLVEKYLHHYKEIEYEVVRDKDDNCVTVCNMENMDPLGIHTGESIVVAPSQTLTNFEYHLLREKSIEIVRSLRIVGECNVQYALNPNPADKSIEFYVIEVNARLSRSSALASKATGYPLAYVAAKLALGKSMIEVKNQVTQVTQSCFEPALDYVVVKIPRWDLEKFKGVEERIGSSMKSVGEVMAIGRTFEEAVQKAARMLDIGVEGITENNFPSNNEDFIKYIKIPTPKRLFALTEALRRGISVSEIYQDTGIDPWYLFRIKKIVEAEKRLIRQPADKKLDYDTLLNLKRLGFSDKRIAGIVGKDEISIRKKRKKLGITPSVFQIDTLAGEVPAKTNYLYMTYNGSHNDIQPSGRKAVVVLGSGPYRIGSSVEFDWTCVNTAINLKKYGKEAIIINCNPETVSTDYDMSEKLYFEELTFERVADIYDFEKPTGVIVSVGGQTPNNLTPMLSKYQAIMLGTKASDIDRAEDRNKFSRLLDTLNIPQPSWNKFVSITDACRFARSVGYPVLIRPSYVLSGCAMSVCFREEELKAFIEKAALVNKNYPVTVSKFIEGAKEIELDAVAQKGKIKVYAISEHIENAGVHSGDATIVYPAQKIYLRTEKRVTEIAEKLVQELHITGPFNIQYIAKENDVYVIEINLRASRTFPFISKVTGVNFAHALVDAFFGQCKKVEIRYPDHVIVKSPQFSFSRLAGADPVLRVEMASTGEVACLGDDVEEAIIKSEISVGAKIPKKGIFLSLGGEENKVRFLDSALRLKKSGLPIYATEKTAKFLKTNGIKTKRLYKIHDKKTPNVLNCFQNGKVDLAVNIVDAHFKKDLDDDYVIRRSAVDHNINLITNRQKAELFIKAISEKKPEDIKIKKWQEYKKPL